jgi:hypothetical protein
MRAHARFAVSSQLRADDLVEPGGNRCGSCTVIEADMYPIVSGLNRSRGTGIDRRAVGCGTAGLQPSPRACEGANMVRPFLRPAARIMAVLMLGGVAAGISWADDDRGDRNTGSDRFRAELSGHNEVHFIAGNAAVTPVVPPALRGAISTTGRGTFKTRIDDAAQSIHYELSYEALEGVVTQAHIHFGQRHTVGGIVVWLCQTTGTPAPPAVASVTPTCPSPQGTVTGSIGPAQVLGATGQGLDAGEFDALVRAIRAGATYANVHSSLFQPGEIRGQIDDRQHKH